MRHVKVRAKDAPNPKALIALVRAAAKQDASE